MQIETTRFGALDIEEGRILDFPEGLPGFEACRHFALVPHGEASPFEWLQSVEDGALAFLAMKPHQIFPDYARASRRGSWRPWDSTKVRMARTSTRC